MRIIPHDIDPDPAVDPALLRTLGAGAFAMRRKRISNSLKPWFSGPEIETLGIDPGLRPERLAPRDFVLLANAAANRDDRADTD